jgi:hypothetical protein
MRPVAATGMVCLVALAHAVPARADDPRIRRRAPDPSRGLVQITGKGARVGQTRYRNIPPADPFVYTRPDGRVEIYGTGPNVLEFERIDDVLRGGPYRTRRIDAKEDLGWDALIHRWPVAGEVLYGGLATGTGRRTRPRWPQDNWTRRIWPFVRDVVSRRWTRQARPLFGAVAPDETPRMVGHAYGHHFKKVGDETWLFHEEISRERPLVTELYARRMLDPFTASEDKVKLLGVGDPPRLGARANGEYLLEGPRPFEARLGGETIHFITFSSGDFFADNYDIHFAWRRDGPIGEYTPILDREGRLAGAAADLKLKYGLSWCGRAHVVEDSRGRPWAVFHAAEKRILPERDYSGRGTDLRGIRRQLFAAPLELALSSEGTPTVRLRD